MGSVSTWLKQQIVKHFLTIHERPKWIQNPEWPIIDDKPMIFVHQVDLSVKNSTIAELFHDDTTLFLFISSQSHPVVVMQQF